MKQCMFLAALCVMVCSSALATTGPALEIQWDGGSVFIGSDVLAPYVNQKGSVSEIKIGAGDCEKIMTELKVQDQICLSSLDFAYDADPYVTGGFSALNPTGVTQTYTFIFFSPVAPAITPTSLYGGSMSGSLTANGTVPATVATVAPDPLYWGIIDGVNVLPIYADPMSWSVNTQYASGTIAAVNVPTTNPYGPVNNSIAMQFKFTLTPGDIATMNGIFEVIPEPATLALLGMGLLFLKKRTL
jgi:hypothetical protein